MSEEWTLERALAVAGRHRKEWPIIPDEKGREPGVGYHVSVLLADEIDALRARVAVLEEELERTKVLVGDRAADAADHYERAEHLRAMVERQAQTIAALEEDLHTTESHFNELQHIYEAQKRDIAALEEAGEAMYEDMRANVGDAYNLLTQGESPTQLRGPSARRIYERSKASQARWREVRGE